MPSTPVSWSVNDFFANTNLNGTQNAPVITQLSNGNVLISWTDLDNTAGTAGGGAAGLDVIGRIFDPLGNAVTGEIRLNVFSTSLTEWIPEITALDNGGFMVVYGGVGAGDDILYETYGATGLRQNGGYVIDDAANGARPNTHAVASATSTSVMTAYVIDNADGSEDVWVRPYNPAANSFGTPFLKWAGSTGAGEDNGGVGIAALSNDNFALAFGNRNALDDTVILNIVNSTGGTLHSATISTGTDINGVQCAGLTGGNVAIVYHDFTSGPVYAAVYSSTAGVVRSAFQISSLSANQIWSSVAALADGGFVVVWDDDINTDIRGRRFDSAGNGVGTEFTIDTAGTQLYPRVTGLADGRFQVTWEEDGDIRSEIFDARDSANNPGVYTPDQWVVGTVGNDVMTPAPSVKFVRGHAGNDVINESAASLTSQYFGDAGDDAFNVASGIGFDLHDGGAGVDTINWSGSGVGAGVVFDLFAGRAILGANTEQMLNFENLIGSANRDIIIGNDAANSLNGGGGNDDIYGSGGADMLDGGAGSDTMDGGLGDDTYFVDFASDIIVEGAGGGAADRVRASVSFTLAADDNIEILQTSNANLTGAVNLTGNALQQSVFGNNGVNTLSGGIDNLVDTLTGYAGDDTYLINSAGDIIVEGAGNGTADRARASVSFTLAADDNIEILQTSNANLNTAINLTGNALAQSVFGNIGSNVLNGGAGIDELTGYAGSDFFLFNTTLNTATNRDVITDFSVAADTIRLENAIFTLLAATGNLATGLFKDVITGGAQDANDVIVYNSNSGNIYYDSNGLTAGGTFLFAEVDNGTLLTAADFVVI